MEGVRRRGRAVKASVAHARVRGCPHGLARNPLEAYAPVGAYTCSCGELCACLACVSSASPCFTRTRTSQARVAALFVGCAFLRCQCPFPALSCLFRPRGGCGPHKGTAQDARGNGFCFNQVVRQVPTSSRFPQPLDLGRLLFV